LCSTDTPQLDDAAPHRAWLAKCFQAATVVYARGTAWIAGADRWTEAMWRNLEQQVSVPEPLEDEQAIGPEGASANIAGILRRRA
jgi:hypothetical protein